MSSRLQVEPIRRVVREAFRQRGADHSAPLCETMLIRGGFFCGWRFAMDGLRATWFFEENQLKLYDRGGQVIGAVCPTECTVELRAA
jgi:hypothetical protein